MYSKPHSCISVNTANLSFSLLTNLHPMWNHAGKCFTSCVPGTKFAIIRIPIAITLFYQFNFNLRNFLTSLLRRIQRLKCIPSGIATSIASLSLRTIKLVTPRNFNLQFLPVLHEMWGRTEVCAVVKEYLVVLFIWVVASERMASFLQKNCLNLCVLCLRAYNKLVKWFQLPFVYELYAKQFKTS